MICLICVGLIYLRTHTFISDEFLMEAHSSPDAFIYCFSALHEVRSCGRKEIEAFHQPDILERRELTSARNEWIQGLVSLTAGSAKYPQSSLFPRSALFAKFNDYLRCKVSERLRHADGSETSRGRCSSASIPSRVVFVILGFVLLNDSRDAQGFLQ